MASIATSISASVSVRSGAWKRSRQARLFSTARAAGRDTRRTAPPPPAARRHGAAAGRRPRPQASVPRRRRPRVALDGRMARWGRSRAGARPRREPDDRQLADDDRAVRSRSAASAGWSSRRPATRLPSGVTTARERSGRGGDSDRPPAVRTMALRTRGAGRSTRSGPSRRRGRTAATVGSGRDDRRAGEATAEEPPPLACAAAPFALP